RHRSFRPRGVAPRPDGQPTSGSHERAAPAPANDQRSTYPDRVTDAGDAFVTPDLQRDIRALVRASVALAGLVLLFDRWLHIGVMSVGFTFLLVVLLTAATARFWASAAASLAAMLALNFFFLPPVRSLYLSDPQNWVALFVFLAVSLVGSNLSTT